MPSSSRDNALLIQSPQRGADRSLLGQQTVLSMNSIEKQKPLLFHPVKLLDKQPRQKLKLKVSSFKLDT